MRIQNWDRWQTFRKDRGTPPWIKVYRNLMTNEAWVSLTDAEKGQLVSIWILAADKDGQIPDNPAVIQRMAMLDTKPNIKKFIDLGFMTTTCQPDGNQLTTNNDILDAPEKRQRREEKRREETDSGFAAPVFVSKEIWQEFINHRKEKRSALKETTYQRIVKDLTAWKNEGHDANQILITSIRNGWTGIFKPKEQKRKATNGASVEYVSDDDLNAWAARNGAPAAKNQIGYTYDKYREDLIRWEQSR